MINFFRNRTYRRKLRNLQPLVSYQNLEERRMLAVGTAFNGGDLLITLTANGDTAAVDVDNGNVTVNGQQIDTDPIQAGIQAATVADIQSMTFIGMDGLQDLSVELGGAFNSNALTGIHFINIHQVDLSGDYLTDMLTGNFLGDHGQFSGAGSIVVNGITNLQSLQEFDFVLDNINNDFGGAFSATTLGSVTLRDVNDVNLNNVSVRNLAVNASGRVEDVAGGTMVVTRATNITASSIHLGNNGNAVDLFAVITNTTGAFELNELNNFNWSNQSSVQSADIQAGGTVNMGPNAHIEIVGDAVFQANRIRLGVGGSNTFNAGRINFNTTANAFIWENSDTVIFGDNSAANLDIISTGNITNVADAVIVVAGISSFQTPGLVSIGNAAGDTFHTNRLQFFANQVNISEDSSIVISGLANFAGNLVLEANGTITDTAEAFIVVEQNATFISAVDDPQANAGVVIGDSNTNFFTAGSISFSVTDGNFLLIENDSTVIASPNGFVNSATAVNIHSAGSLVNGNQAVVQVQTTAILAGTSISIGQAMDDDIRFGSLTLTTDGNATVSEDDGILLTGTLFVGGNLGLSTIGFLGDSNISQLTVLGNALFVGGSIILGDLPAPDNQDPIGDILSTGSLRFFSSGNVEITHDGDILLQGGANHTANELRLTANSTMTQVGNISNLPGANVVAQGNMFVHADGDITLGTNPMDVINFNNLNFRSPGNVTITALFANPASNFNIFGTNANANLADELRLITNVDVSNGVNATIIVDSFVRIEARNITLGQSATDCVMLPASSEFITTDLPPDVTLDLVCP